jgi:hypothetical protein
MKLPSGLVFVSLLGIGLSSYSCANGDTVSGSSGNGGSNSSEGGSTGNGGSTSHNGGTTGAGGSVSHTGGTPGTGGSVSHTGGTTGTGGNIVSTGGTPGNGGTTGAGGTSSTGAGGSGESCAPTFDPTNGGWVTAPAAGTVGCFHGYAYNFADALGTTITPGTSMTYASCGTTCSLTATGSVIIANAANSYSTYAGIGFNLNQPSSGGAATPTVVPQGSGLTITFTASTGTDQLRAQITDGTTNYCYVITGSSPVTIPWTSFNTKCYDPTPDGTPYNKQPISAFQLQVAGGMSMATYSIALTGLVENN